jgi:hypothetical protein
MNRVEVIGQLQAEEKALREKLERLRKPLLQIEEDLQHIAGTIAFYQRNDSENKVVDLVEAFTDMVTVIPASKLRGLTHSKAVVAIAKSNGGVVRAQDAKRLMIKAGIMSQTKNSTNMTHNAILRTELFDRIGPGEFRLKEYAAADNRDQEGFGFRPVQ